jgi:SNF2 family DNA or RNA helicase
MVVSNTEPFKLIYSIFEHQYLGYLMESYVSELNSKGQVTYKCQNVSSKNILEFKDGIDETDIELVKLIDNIQQDVVYKKFNNRKLSPSEFYIKVFHPENGEKLIADAINDYIEKYKKDIFSKIKNKSMYIMSSDGIPSWREVMIHKTEARVYFHFKREEEQTVYYPILKCGPEKIKFQFKNAKIINEVPAALLIDENLYLFDEFTEGKKIRPFFNKPNIIIPKKIEETYYKKFIVPLIANFNVYADGFEIIHDEAGAIPIIKTEEIENQISSDLFGNKNQSQSSENKMTIELLFEYGNKEFKFESFSSPSHVFLEKTEDSYKFTKVKRDLKKEKEIHHKIKDLGLDLKNGKVSKSKHECLEWLQYNVSYLYELGVKIVQNESKGSNYFLGFAKIELKINEKNDWFDIQGLVQFGDFTVPFSKIIRYILSNTKELELPNGQIAIIPKEWFTQYSELFQNIDNPDTAEPRLKKYHVGIVHHLDNEGLAVTVMNRRLQKLRDFEEIEEVELPKVFRGELRAYQKAGYDWLHFLKSYNFGGCLADDMGLGKTVTTLAFLQKIKEEGSPLPSILVMPTSIIYNWQKEAAKFTPNLKILIHFGPFRAKDASAFERYDLLICSYGILRIDIEFISKFSFNYAILDESQAIKNATSLISTAVMKLNTKNRIILTGTPLENSTLDLWSQMSFINPGLLGSLASFKTKFQIPIEKQKNEIALKNLFSKIKPFMLRRHKSQVAKDLPEKIETIQYCQMSEQQEKLYEETKSYIRNKLINEIGAGGIKKSSILVLQGLNKLRQIANNPKMVDEDFEGESGKDSDILYKLIDVTEEGYKTLVFSQYVKHLTLIREKLDELQIPYLYLDGSTQKRQELVDEFQTNPNIKVFLISLKAGGVGLNLTAAEYVFMLDPWWNPAIEAQAIDRAHRIGQKNTVFSYKFISKNTIEEKILDLQNSKKQLFNELITNEEGFVKSLSEEDIISLLE